MKMNQGLEPIMKEERELNNGIERLNLRQLSDRNGPVSVDIGMVYTAKTWYGLRRSQYHVITGRYTRSYRPVRLKICRVKKAIVDLIG